MSEFIKSSAAIDKIVGEATNVEQMREALKAQLVREGRIARDPESLGYGVQVVPGQEPPPAPVAAAQQPEDHDRVFRVIYPSGNNRFEIYGADEKELDAKEAAIRAMFA